MAAIESKLSLSRTQGRCLSVQAAIKPANGNWHLALSRYSPTFRLVHSREEAAYEPPQLDPPQTKLRVYEAVYFLNRSFEAAIHSVDRLERLEFFANDYLTALKTQVEYLRAEANWHLVENLQEYEENETSRLDEFNREREKELNDPDDVFFAARDREQEIKEQIKELKGGLARKHPGRKSRKTRKRRKKQD